jgi:hypothetical protein
LGIVVAVEGKDLSVLKKKITVDPKAITMISQMRTVHRRHSIIKKTATTENFGWGMKFYRYIVSDTLVSRRRLTNLLEIDSMFVCECVCFRFVLRSIVISMLNVEP